MKSNPLRASLVTFFLLSLVVWIHSQAIGQDVGTKSPTPTASDASEVQRLKKENEILKKENQELRKLLATGGSPSVSPSAPAVKTKAEATSKWTISSTGKRHNSSCRYYGTGRSGGPTDGVACKICGG